MMLLFLLPQYLLSPQSGAHPVDDVQVDSLRVRLRLHPQLWQRDIAPRRVRRDSVDFLTY